MWATMDIEGVRGSAERIAGAFVDIDREAPDRQSAALMDARSFSELTSSAYIKLRTGIISRKSLT